MAKIWEILEQIPTKLTKIPHTYGLCFLVSSAAYEKGGNLLDTWILHKADAFSSWPLCSGDSVYPVPHPHKDPGKAFDECTYKDMWNKNTVYGHNRWNLLEHCINWFKERDL